MSKKQITCDVCGQEPAIRAGNNYCLCGDCIEERIDELLDLRHEKNHLKDAIKVLSRIIAEIEL